MNQNLKISQIGNVTVIGKAGTISAQLAHIAAMHSYTAPCDQDIDANAPNYNPKASQVQA